MITKAGQLITINHTVYRAKKREGCGCSGCDLNSIWKCPNMVYTNVNNAIGNMPCDALGIILKRVSP